MEVRKEVVDATEKEREQVAHPLPSIYTYLVYVYIGAVNRVMFFWPT